MRNLATMLHEADPALLPILAKRWGVQALNLSATPDQLIQALAAAMIDPPRAESIYDALDDKQRGALQTLNANPNRAMQRQMFEALFGVIRSMGSGQIEREKPHERPANVSEALYYRGLIGKGNDKVGAGIGPVVYIPEDLAQILPTRKTSYSPAALEAFAATSDEVDDRPAVSASGAVNVPAHVQPLSPDEVENVVQADTSIIDDMTTLLAFLQLYSPALTPEFVLEDAALDELLKHMLVPQARRVQFMIGVGITAELVEIQAGKAYPRRAEVRRWLADKRSAQLKWLTDAWRKSLDYAELWHIDGLYPEAGWSYDPAEARQAAFAIAKETLPKGDWWTIDDFIDVVKVRNPNFQRPGGDYESWYIRDEANEYLHGLNSWDAVEGAVLSFYFTHPMHWLGLADAADDAVRLTAYGRAFIDAALVWPAPAETDDKIVVQPDGTLVASRKVPRIDRFQMARFSSWTQAATLKGEPYIYRIDAAGIQRAEQQGINTGHIGSFVSRILDGGAVPPIIAKLLENWRSGPTATVTLEQLLVLRTTAPETLDFIYETPSLRRYLGARLGPMAVIVRSSQWEGLRDALGERGIQVDIIGQ